jgi:hypothetical protein
VTNPFPFVAGATLTAAELNAIGETETWTPNFLTGVTVGNGTVSGFYQRVNDFVVVQGSFELGSTSAITGDVRVDVPIDADVLFNLSNSIKAQFYDFSTATYWQGTGSAYGAGQHRIRALLRDTSADYVYARQLTSSVPFTWATNDRIDWTGVYRVGT